MIILYDVDKQLIPITILNNRISQTKILGIMATNRDLLKEAIADAKSVNNRSC